jgi:putative DNA-invertase from lambdoid prophage Rac
MARKPKAAATPAAPRTVAYVRVSTADQANNGHSLATQAAQLAAWATLAGLAITETAVEGGTSGAKPFAARPEGGKLWLTLQRGDVLAVTKLDRLGRNLIDILRTCRELQARGVKVYSLDISATDALTGNGVSQLLLSMMGAVAEFERGRISERIKDRKAEQRRNGERSGSPPPFGWKLSGDAGDKGRVLVENPEEQAVIKRVLMLAGEGLSYRQISTELAGRLSHMSVRKIIIRGGEATEKREHSHG